MQENYIPPVFVHRDKEINELNRIFYTYKKYKILTNNLFIFGPAGTGKTQITLKYLKELNLEYIYCSCREYKTMYQVLRHIAESTSNKKIHLNTPTSECFALIKNILKDRCVIVLDDIQSVIKDKNFDNIMFGLSRLTWNESSKQTMLIIIGNISINDLKNNLSTPTIDGLKLRYIYFPKYNAMQLEDILKNRKDAFYKLPEKAIRYISAYVAQQWGSARYALDLLRESSILAEIKNKTDVDEEDVEESIKTVEEKEFENILLNLPTQALLVCEALTSIKLPATTSQVYDSYRKLCTKHGYRILTLRRLNDILSDLEGDGIVNTKIEFRGRYGRKRIIMDYCLDKDMHNKYIRSRLNL